ncbi:MAG: glycosyl hydrolase family 18 protein [Fusicatenibacter sp.]
MQKKKRKKSVLPVLITIGLILLISICGVISFLMERYRPGTERMDRAEYFGLTGEDQVALIQNGTVREEKGLLIGGEPYGTYEYVESCLNSCFYWDRDTQQILLTTPEEIKQLIPGDTSVCATPRGQAAVQIGEDGTIYLSLDVVKEYTDMEYAFYNEPARVVIDTRREQTTQAEVSAQESQVRYRGGIKSEILTDVYAGDTLTILDEMDEWSKVETTDGYIGYIKREDLSETFLTEKREASVMMEFSRITRDHKINLVWHQTTSAAANAAFAEMTANMSGVNVISPTWFSVTDNSGILIDRSSAEYVSQAHAAGLEVWGLIENFDPNFDSSEALASSAVRANVISQLMAAAESCGMDGINVDFENLKETAIPHFLQFLRELTMEAHKRNLVVSVDTPVPQSYTEYYDRAEQAKYVDYMIMMGYDEHYAGSEEAGSVASLPFVQAGIEEMLDGIPKEQVICGIPFYTRVWIETFGQNAITSEVLGMDGASQYAEQAGMAINWDGSLGQNVAISETEQARYTIWMEDEDSIAEKMKLIMQYDLAGVAEWKLGFERADVWEIIAGYLK